MDEDTVTDTRSLEVERSTSTAHRLLHYDGVCGNIHGHNMKWEVSIYLSMEDVGEDNMPLDFKEISDTIDEVDHAVLLNEADPLKEQLDNPEEVLGDVMWFESDPTCEMLVDWMARRLENLSENIFSVEVACSETDKYSMSGYRP